MISSIIKVIPIQCNELVQCVGQKIFLKYVFIYWTGSERWAGWKSSYMLIHTPAGFGGHGWTGSKMGSGYWVQVSSMGGKDPFTWILTAISQDLH